MEQPKVRKSFRIGKLKKEFFLNPFSLADEDWRKEQWPDGSWWMRFVKVDKDVTLSLLWRVIDDDGKRIIANAKLVKWDGLKESPLEFDSPEEKLSALMADEEIAPAWLALFQTIRGSDPEEAENLKKKIMEEFSLLTRKALTSSPQNTDSVKSNLKGSQENELAN